MLRCPKCGADNLLSAVFCRSCGDRLDLDKIKPDDLMDIGVPKKSHTLQNIIGGSTLGTLLLIFLILFFFPACGSISTSDDDRSAIIDKYKERKKTVVAEFDDKTASAYVSGKLADAIKDTSTLGSPYATAATIHFLEGEKNIKIVLNGKMKFMPCALTITAKAECSGGRISIADASYRFGLLPVPKGLEEQLVDSFVKPVKDAMNADNNNLAKLEIADGSAKVTYEPPKPKVEPKPEKGKKGKKKPAPKKK